MTTNAEAEPTSATKREKERATEVAKTRRESKVEDRWEDGAWEEWPWGLWRAKGVRLGFRWRHNRCLERENTEFVFGERESEEEGEGELEKNVEMRE